MEQTEGRSLVVQERWLAVKDVHFFGWRVQGLIEIVLIILPMQQSKSVKTFNLATSLNDYSQEASVGVQQRMRLQANLFDQEAPQKIKAIRFDEQRAFDFVGVKELKAYYERARRVSKDKRKDTLTLSMGLSRHSVISRQEDDLYNKWQIIERVENKLEKQTQVNSNQSALSKLDLTLRAPTPPTPATRMKKRPEVRHTDSSSILKMRNNFRNYREVWERQQLRAEQTKGFPSLLRLATESRSVSVKKALDEQSFKKENIPPRMWAEALRGDCELKNIYDQTGARFMSSKGQRLTVSGKNKLALQKDWVSRKGDEGYKFQLLKKETVGA